MKSCAVSRQPAGLSFKAGPEGQACVPAVTACHLLPCPQPRAGLTSGTQGERTKKTSEGRSTEPIGRANHEKGVRGHSPPARAPAAPGIHRHTPCRSAAPAAARRRSPRGGRRPPGTQGQRFVSGHLPCHSGAQIGHLLVPQPRASPTSLWHLAGAQHVRDGAAAQVGRGDDVLLPTRVAGGHSFGRGHGDAFRHSDEVLRGGDLGRRHRGGEDLRRERHRGEVLGRQEGGGGPAALRSPPAPGGCALSWPPVPASPWWPHPPQPSLSSART